MRSKRHAVTLLAAALTGVGLVGVVAFRAAAAAPSLPVDLSTDSELPATADIHGPLPQTGWAKRSTVLVVGGPNALVALLQFDGRDLSGPAERATLRVFIESRTHARLRISLRQVAGDAEKAELVPAITVSSVAVTAGVRRRGWLAIDVTRLLDGESGRLSFEVRSIDRRVVRIASRERSARAPSLNVRPAPMLLAVGDIAYCPAPGETSAADALAAQLRDTPGIFAPVGDLVYPNGTPQEFQQCYDPAFGPLKERTRPAPGNHEYHTRGAGGYFDYFGALAGRRDQGYYAYRLRDWLVVVLNSTCAEIGGCGDKSRQAVWLQDELSRSSAKCTLAYWHQPYRASGPYGRTSTVAPLWRILFRYGVDVVVNGHAHNYERLAPMDDQGKLDGVSGIRTFVVGTGGRSLLSIEPPVTNSEVRNNTAFGFLVLRLWDGAYSWEFRPLVSGGFKDAGEAQCH